MACLGPPLVGCRHTNTCKQESTRLGSVTHYHTRDTDLGVALPVRGRELECHELGQVYLPCVCVVCVLCMCKCRCVYVSIKISSTIRQSIRITKPHLDVPLAVARDRLVLAEPTAAVLGRSEDCRRDQVPIHPTLLPAEDPAGQELAYRCVYMCLAVCVRIEASGGDTWNPATCHIMDMKINNNEDEDRTYRS